MLADLGDDSMLCMMLCFVDDRSVVHTRRTTKQQHNLTRPRMSSDRGLCLTDLRLFCQSMSLSCGWQMTIDRRSIELGVFHVTVLHANLSNLSFSPRGDLQQRL